MEIIYESLSDSLKYIYFKLSSDHSDGKASNRKAIYDREGWSSIIPPHFHKSAEIKLIIDGSMMVGIDGEELKLSKGQICFLDSYKVHYYIENTSESFDLVFDAELLKKIVGENKTFSSIITNKKTFKELLKLFRETYPKFSEYDAHQQTGFLSKVIGILLTNEPLEEKVYDIKSSTARNIIAYIYENYTQPLDIKKLAKAFGYTEGYISTVIKKTTKCNFREYLNKYRIGVADTIKEENPKKSLREISEEVGYESWVTFYRAYKKYSKTQNPKDVE